MLLAGIGFGELPPPQEEIADALVQALEKLPGLTVELDAEPLWLEALELRQGERREQQPGPEVLATCLAVHERLLRRLGFDPSGAHCVAALPAARLLALAWQQRLAHTQEGAPAGGVGLPKPGPALKDGAAEAEVTLRDLDGLEQVYRWHADPLPALLATPGARRAAEEGKPRSY